MAQAWGSTIAWPSAEGHSAFDAIFDADLYGSRTPSRQKRVRGELVPRDSDHSANGNDEEAAMARLGRLTLLSLVGALLLCSPRFGSVSAQTVPIIDLHFHADQAWDVHALVKLFDELGVAAAGNGARGSDGMALKF